MATIESENVLTKTQSLNKHTFINFVRFPRFHFELQSLHCSCELASSEQIQQHLLNRISFGMSINIPKNNLWVGYVIIKYLVILNASDQSELITIIYQEEKLFD